MRERTVSPEDLVTRKPFSDLFPIDPVVRAGVLAKMRKDGYDIGEPIDVWHDGTALVVVDGHTRLECVRELGIARLPAVEYFFATQLEALRHAFDKQKNRRNWTGAVKHRAVQIVDRELVKEKGGNNPYGRSGKPREEIEKSFDFSISVPDSEETRYQTGRIVGVSPSTVQRSRLVASDPEVEEMLLSDPKMSLNKAATIVREKRREQKAVEPAPPAQNGAKPTAVDPRTESWYAVRVAGMGVEVAMIEAMRRVRKELDALASAGLTVSSFMGNRKVSPGWNRALDQASGIRRLLRETIRSTEDGDEE